MAGLRLLLAQALLLWAGVCTARAATIDVHAETGRIHVPEHLLPAHKRPRSTQRMEANFGFRETEAEGEEEEEEEGESSSDSREGRGSGS